MLIALLYLIHSFFGGGTASLADRIEASVAEDRREAALEIATRVDELEAELARATEDATRALRAIHQRHAANEQDYTNAVRSLEEARASITAELLDARQELAARLLDEEWAAIFGKG